MKMAHCQIRRLQKRLIPLAMILLTSGPGTIVRGGSIAAEPHVRVVCDFEDDDAAKSARDIAEQAWTQAANLWGRAAETPPAPRDLHLYSTIAAYEAVEATITRGRFKPNLAFTDWETVTAYVVLQP